MWCVSITNLISYSLSNKPSSNKKVLWISHISINVFFLYLLWSFVRETVRLLEERRPLPPHLVLLIVPIVDQISVIVHLKLSKEKQYNIGSKLRIDENSGIFEIALLQLRAYIHTGKIWKIMQYIFMYMCTMYTHAPYDNFQPRFVVQLKCQTWRD